MCAEPGAPHHVPHFHAYYQDQVGIFSFDPVELIAGSLPAEASASRGSVGGVAQAELAGDWRQLQTGRKPELIEPLQ